ncbi:GHMP kinase [Dialister succinatiphilus]|uniref:GHMP family kinase ATP-binding protein n=1 Tax=Dialister succinatiphilus TaxID=487173 RepID=UPI0023530C77|nr:GHMP kinase [Dialister succinatiphilus]
MAYVVSSPGSCGEFIQGYAEGSSFMVTCPIDRFSYAFSGFEGEGEPLPPKALSAVEKTMAYLGEEKRVPLKLKSHILKGKGMASSTADISAACQAAALACGRKLSEREIAAIALSIEPSDATFFKGVVQFDYREGRLIREMGLCPAMQILVYDCGGEVDTMLFNSRNDLVDLQKSNETKIKEALSLFKEGIRLQSLDLIGRAASMSSFANQKILYKKPLGDFYRLGMEQGGKGVICAHSGTVLGLILPMEKDAMAVKNFLDKEMKGRISFLDLVHITNQGMQCRKCDIHDFEKL